jgi:hypothetical protein
MGRIGIEKESEKELLFSLSNINPATGSFEG